MSIEQALKLCDDGEAIRAQFSNMRNVMLIWDIVPSAFMTIRELAARVKELEEELEEPRQVNARIAANVRRGYDDSGNPIKLGDK